MDENTAQKKSHKKLIIRLSLMTCLMFGFGYALVPMYNVLCKSLGINGKTGGETALSDEPVDYDRIITIQFLATRNAEIDWEFKPKERTIRLHPGENKKIAYRVKNLTDNTMTVQAIPSVTPGLTAKYLKKTECFCFTQQTMKGHEEMDWPLIFHIDKDIPKKYKTITLSYTLFDVTNMAKNPPKGVTLGHIN